MSRQSKGANNKARAKQFSDLRKSGGSGPKSTEPKHGKKNTKWNHPETAKARAAVLGKYHDKQDNKSVLEKINEKKEKVKIQNKQIDDAVASVSSAPSVDASPEAEMLKEKLNISLVVETNS